MADTVFIYYSFEGNVEFLANHLAKFTQSDIVRIRAMKEPPKKGIGKMIVGGAGVVMKRKVRIAPAHLDLSGYKNVILCYPIWAGTFPPAVNTFLSDNDITGNLYVITSSKSGNGEKSVGDVEEKTGVKVMDCVHFKNPLKDRNRSRKFAEAFIVKNGI